MIGTSIPLQRRLVLLLDVVPLLAEQLLVFLAEGAEGHLQLAGGELDDEEVLAHLDPAGHLEVEAAEADPLEAAEVYGRAALTPRSPRPTGRRSRREPAVQPADGPTEQHSPLEVRRIA